MLCKVIQRAVSNSEKSHEVFLNGGSRLITSQNSIGYTSHGDRSTGRKIREECISSRQPTPVAKYTIIFLMPSPQYDYTAV